MRSQQVYEILKARATREEVRAAMADLGRAGKPSAFRTATASVERRGVSDIVVRAIGRVLLYLGGGGTADRGVAVVGTERAGAPTGAGAA